MKSLLTTSLVLLFSLSLFSQTTRLVPQDFPSIQSALSASQADDIVLVSPGVYFENITWNDNQNGVELRSTDGPESTIIDANNNGRGVYFDGDMMIDETTVMDGFTIQNGYVFGENWAKGAGVFVMEASPILRNLIIQDNKVEGNKPRGAGISFDESLSNVENCIIRNNSMESDGWAYGGGIFVDDSHVDFYNCKILNNASQSSSWSHGGGIYFNDSDGKMQNCVIKGNSVNGLWSYGAGLYFSAFLGVSEVDILGCSILENKPLGGNWNGGIGLYAYRDVNLNIINTIIHDNGPTNSTLYLENENTNIINSTIVNNDGGIICREATLNVTNSIVWNNGFAITTEDFGGSSSIEVEHCVIEGGYSGPGNINDDPLFVNDELFVPSENSPCLNAGSRDIPIVTDILGNKRPLPRGSAPDIGAYEINQDFAHVLTRFFYDENLDGVQDPGEDLIGRGAIINPDGEIKINTNLNGLFTLMKQGESEIEVYDFDTDYWLLSSPVKKYSFNVITEEFADTIYFGIFPNRETKDLDASLYCPPLRCSRTIKLEFFVKNVGNTIVSEGVLWADLDPLVSEIMPIMTADYIDGNRYGWKFEKLVPGEVFTRYVSLKVPGVEEIEQGATLKFVSEATVVDDPQCITNFCFEDEIRCSFDPNDKLVNPSREDQLVLRDNDITYTIRFQNVGNDYADDVVVRDTLDPNFDFASFRLLKTSHPEVFNYSFTTNGVLTFDFPKIYLPDSTTNEEGSHGYIMYSITPDSSLVDYAEVKNTAHIYFDFNPAIVTNTTKNSVVEDFPVGTIDEQANLLEINPNPTSGQIYLSETFDKIEVVNSSGQRVRSFFDSDGFDLSSEVDGLYFIKAVKDSHEYFGRIVLTRL